MGRLASGEKGEGGLESPNRDAPRAAAAVAVDVSRGLHALVGGGLRPADRPVAQLGAAEAADVDVAWRFGGWGEIVCGWVVRRCDDGDDGSLRPSMYNDGQTARAHAPFKSPAARSRWSQPTASSWSVPPQMRQSRPTGPATLFLLVWGKDLDGDETDVGWPVGASNHTHHHHHTNQPKTHAHAPLRARLRLVAIRSSAHRAGLGLGRVGAELGRVPHPVAAPAEERLVQQEVARVVAPAGGPPAEAAVGGLEEYLGGWVVVWGWGGWVWHPSSHNVITQHTTLIHPPTPIHAPPTTHRPLVDDGAVHLFEGAQGLLRGIVRGDHHPAEPLRVAVLEHLQPLQLLGFWGVLGNA